VAAVRGDDSGEWFGEGVPRTRRLVTEEAAGVKINLDGHPRTRQISEGTAVTAVNTR
jgi:hypothetical protein